MVSRAGIARHCYVSVSRSHNTTAFFFSRWESTRKSKMLDGSIWTKHTMNEFPCLLHVFWVPSWGFLCRCLLLLGGIQDCVCLRIDRLCWTFLIGWFLWLREGSTRWSSLPEWVPIGVFVSLCVCMLGLHGRFDTSKGIADLVDCRFVINFYPYPRRGLFQKGATQLLDFVDNFRRDHFFRPPCRCMIPFHISLDGFP